MRWRRFTFWAVVGTLALIVLFLSWLWTADLGVFKPQLERFVAEKTGREFTIDGALHVDLARHASLIAEDVHFGNADWATPDDMVTVGRLEVRVDLRSLLRGPFIIELVDIDDASVYLVSPADGEPNWVLPVATGEEPPGHEQARGPGLLLGQLDIDNVSIVLDSAQRDRPLDIEIRRLQQTHRDDDFLDLELRATLNGRSVSIDGEVGTWDALLAGKDFEFDADAVLDTFRLSAKGRIDDLANLRRPEIEFAASGPDIDDLTRLLGLGEEGEGDIDISGTLERRNDDGMLLNVKGNIGMTQIDASGTVADLKSFDNIGLKAVASGPDLGRILRLVGIHQVRQAPFMLRLDAETRGEEFLVKEAEMVFADAHLNAAARFPHFPSVDDAIVSLQIEGPDMERFRYITGVPGAATGPFALGFTVDVGADGVEVLDLNVATSLGKLHADGRIGDPETFIGSRADFSVETDSLASVAGAYGLADMPDVAIGVTGSAEYVEQGIRTLAPVTVTMDKVSARLEGLVPLTAGITGADVTFDARGSDLAALVGMFAQAPGIPALKYTARGRLQMQEGGLRIRGVNGSLGKSSIKADGLLAFAPGLAGSHFEINAGGAAFEEVVESLGEVAVRPGPYQLSGRVDFTADAVSLKNVMLDRAQGDLKLNLAIGMPASKRSLDFDLRANGGDVRSVLRGIKRFEAYEQPFSIRALGRSRGSHWTFDELNVSVGDAKIGAQGDLEFADTRASTEFRFDLNVPSLARLGTIDGRRFREQALAIKAHAAGAEGMLVADQLDVRIGDSDIRGTVKLIKGAVPEVDVAVRSDQLIYLPFLEEREFEYDPEPEFEDGRLIPDVKVPFEALKKINAIVEVDIRHLERGALLLDDISLDMTLRDGAFG